MSHPGPVSVIQISYDVALLDSRSHSDSARRQRTYARLLADRRPGSSIVTVVLSDKRVSYIVRGNTEPTVIQVRRRRGVGRIVTSIVLLRTLRKRGACAGSVVTTQSVQDEAWVALLYCRLAKIPIIGQVHGDLFSVSASADSSKSIIVASLRSALTRRSLRWFTAIRAVGNATAEDLRCWNPNVQTIPVTMPVLRTDYGTCPPATAPSVLFVGRLVAAKNMNCWLEAAKTISVAVPGCSFEIVGDGPLRPMLESEASRLGIGDSVAFRGLIAYDDLHCYYTRASVFMLTSSFEGFGRVVVEAQGFGLPVVASHIAGVEDIVLNGESGFLVSPLESDRFAERVITLLRDPKLAREMGSVGMRHVLERFDPDSLAEAYIDLLTRVADSADGSCRRSGRAWPSRKTRLGLHDD